MAVSISKVTPDFDSLYQELQSRLEAKRTWSDTLPTSVGTTVLDLFAGANVSNQLYLDIAFREAFLSTAVRDSSIFANARMLGVNIARKVPSSCVAELSNFTSRTRFFPPYSEFIVDGRTFFNRSQYIIPPGSTISNVDLFDGTVKEKVFDLSRYSDLALKEFFLGDPEFVASNQDILVYTEDINTGDVEVWSQTDKAIYEQSPDDRVYFASTTRDGDLSMIFGDGNNGSLLKRTQNLNVRYVVTDGLAGNNGLPGIPVRYSNDDNIKGETVTAISGGADEKSALYYKQFAPNMARTNRRAISGSDIRAIIMGRPGIADASVLGQREIAPNDNRWMNTIRICLLPEEEDSYGGANPNPTSSQWRAFKDWIQPKLHAAYAIQTWNPTKVFVNVRMKIALVPSADENEIRAVASENILKLFRKKPGILGRLLSQSDLVNAVRTIEGVDYVDITSPDEDIEVADRTQYIVLDGQPILDIVYSERALGIRG